MHEGGIASQRLKWYSHRNSGKSWRSTSSTRSAPKARIARSTRSGYERRFRTELASGLNPFVAGFVERLWDHSDRIVRFFESEGATPMPPLKAAAIARALDAGRTDEVRTLLDEAIDRFRTFAGNALLNNRSELALDGGTKPREKTWTQKQYDGSLKQSTDRAASRGWTVSKGNSS